ncbi:MAG: 8-amino-7-oxononanoate synthase, partial [Bacteroidia bacterium]|nr:8-amino-7-oxononanoate synthase [Bacteroidia bacterium]
MISQSIRERIDKFQAAAQLKQRGIYPYFRPLEMNYGTEVVIKGKKVLMFGSNSYLGLTHHPKVKESARFALEHYGTGCSGSRFLNGNSLLHEQ